MHIVELIFAKTIVHTQRALSNEPFGILIGVNTARKQRPKVGGELHLAPTAAAQHVVSSTTRYRGPGAAVFEGDPRDRA